MAERSPWRLAVAALAALTTAGVAGASAVAAAAAFGWPWELASHFRVHYLLGGMVGTLLFWAAGRRRWAALPAVLAAVHALYLVGLYLPAPAPPQDARPVRVMALNVLRSNDRYPDVLDEIRRQDPDIVLLQEVTPAWVAALAELEEGYPYSLVESRSHFFGLALFSRVELSDLRVLTLVDDELPSIEARLAIGDTRVRLLGTHPPPPVRRSAAARRDAQLVEIERWVERDPLPAVVVGDLNVSPWSPRFRRLRARSGLRNAMQGKGVVPTWPVDRPLLRIPIDHCLHDPALRVANAFRGREVGSDHYPLIVDLVASTN